MSNVARVYVYADIRARSNAPKHVVRVIPKFDKWSSLADTSRHLFPGKSHFHTQRHCADSFCSYQLDDLSEVRCLVTMTKQLPQCEHEASMKCSDNPARFSCNNQCSGVMACCGRTCKASCHQCVQLNLIHDPNVLVPEHVGPVPRQQHQTHFCEKTLFCGHICGNACSENHDCVTSCKKACRQVCKHASCKNYCSSPCAPCQEACTWQVFHLEYGN